MNRDKFIELLKAEKLSKEDLSLLDQLIEEYPYFGLPKFLRLKIAHENSLDFDANEISQAVVFSNDRKYLYNWIQGEFNQGNDLPLTKKSELEFIDEDEALDNAVDSSADPFELMNEDLNSEVDEIDVKVIPEKEEVEMEEPEIEGFDEIPVMDHLQDVDDLEDQDPVPDVIQKKTREIISQEKILTRTTDAPSSKKPNKSAELIESFLQSSPGVIKADKETSLEGDVSKYSVQEDDSF
ncbi:hypothetical protein ACFLRQ_03435, partial [Bacteroidota bacterium]